MGFVGARFVQRYVLWIKLQPASASAPGGDGGTSKEMHLAPGRGCHGARPWHGTGSVHGTRRWPQDPEGTAGSSIRMHKNTALLYRHPPTSCNDFLSALALQHLGKLSARLRGTTGHLRVLHVGETLAWCCWLDARRTPSTVGAHLGISYQK